MKVNQCRLWNLHKWLNLHHRSKGHIDIRVEILLNIFHELWTWDARKAKHNNQEIRDIKEKIWFRWRGSSSRPDSLTVAQLLHRMGKSRWQDCRSVIKRKIRIIVRTTVCCCFFVCFLFFFYWCVMLRRSTHTVALKERPACRWHAHVAHVLHKICNNCGCAACLRLIHVLTDGALCAPLKSD